MKEQFKPGDVVRKPGITRTVKSAGDHGEPGWLTFTDGENGWAQDYELAEPSIPVSKLREVFLDHIEDPKLWAGLNANSSLMFVSSECNKKVRGLFEAITGESLQKETP